MVCALRLLAAAPASACECGLRVAAAIATLTALRWFPLSLVGALKVCAARATNLSLPARPSITCPRQCKPPARHSE